MRHFLGYDDTGNIFIQIVHTGGHRDDCNIDDPNCTDPLAVKIRASAQKAADTHGITLQGITEFVCGCSSEVATCLCASNKRINAYWCTTNNCLVNKPDVTLLVDGVSASDGDEFVKTPSTLFTVKLTCPDAADGETAELRQSFLHPTGLHTLTFTNNTTNEITFTVPSQGLTGSFTVFGKCVKPMTVSIKAFA